MVQVDHRKTHLELTRLRKQIADLQELADAGKEADELKTLLTKSDEKVKRLSKENKELKDKLKKQSQKKFFSKE